MKLLNEFFRKEEKRKRIISEKRVFKQEGYGYYVKRTEDGGIEFWAHLEDSDSRYSGLESYFFGVWTEEDGLVESPDFRKMRWGQRKPVERLRKYMLGRSYKLGED